MGSLGSVGFLGSLGSMGSLGSVGSLESVGFPWLPLRFFYFTIKIKVLEHIIIGLFEDESLDQE